MRLLTLSIFVLWLSVCHGQQQTRHWFLNQNHISVTPSAVTTALPQPPTGSPGSFYVSNKSTSISDAQGNLLFAFDGNKIINRNLAVMPAMANVNLGGSSSRMLIQQLPGSYLFYVFYVTRNNSNVNSSFHLKYAIVDLTLNGGLGDVTAYDLSVTTNSSPSFTIVQGNDPLDLWLVTHRCATDSFYTYRITSGGLTEPPVTSKAGTVASTENYIFYDLKASFDGKSIAGVAYRDYSGLFAATFDFIEVFNFETGTAKITSRLRSRRGSGYYTNFFSLEFSPNNQLLYLMRASRVYGLQPCGFGSGAVWQYNLCYSDSLNFYNNGILVGQTFDFCYPMLSWGCMQMGADKRLHLPFTGVNVSTINYPNRIGTSCEYVFNSYQLPVGNSGTVSGVDFTHEMMEKAVINNIIYDGGCFPDPINFHITNDTIARAEWDFGDPASGSNTSNLLHPSHIFSSPGIYTVTARLFNTTNVLIETVVEKVEIVDPGVRLLNGYPTDTTFCAGGQLKIKLNPVTNGFYEWFQLREDGTRYNQNKVDSMLLSFSGTWYVEMRQNDCNGCIRLDSIKLEVLEKPDFDLGYNRNLCLGDSLMLGYQNMPGTHLWNTGHTESSLWIKQGGLYWLESELNNNGCLFRDSIVITAVPGVTFALPGDTVLCNNETLLLNPVVANASSYLWQDGSQNAQYQVTKPGKYWLRATSSNGCSRSDTILVGYISAQGVELGNDTILCKGSNLLLGTSISGATYLWSNGETGNTVSVSQTGEYWLRVNNGSCIISDTIRVVFNDPPDLSLGRDTTLCTGERLNLNPVIPNASYIWQNGSVGNSFNITSPGLYWLEVNQFSCVVRDTIVVNYFNVPVMSLGPDLRFCRGDSANLQATAGFTQYSWNGIAGSAQLMVHLPGTYTIVGTTADGCFAKDTMIVQSFFPQPTVDIGDAADICFGKKLVLNAGSGFSFYNWSNGNSGQTISVDAIGSYSVIATDQNGCRAYDTMTVRSILPLPANFLFSDTAICSYGNLLLKPVKTFNMYQWSTGSNTPSITITQPGVYWLKATDNSNCTGSDTVIVKQKDCMLGLYVPTAFTPNNDGKNDTFYPLLFGDIRSYRFTIYNRWGEIIFNSTVPGRGWDGRYKGQPQDSNVYMWVCSFQLSGSEPVTEKGTVMLVR